MSGSFVFNVLTDNEIMGYYNTALVYNVNKNDIGQLLVVENKFTTDDMGGSAEKVDIFVVMSDTSIVDLGTITNTSKFFVPVTGSESGTYNLLGIMEVLDSKGVEYRGLLVVTRIMSNFILDAKTHKVVSHYYNICSDEVSKFLEDNPMIDGWLAKKQVVLQGNFKEEILKVLETSKESNELSEYSYDLYKKALES
jgi:hypothetical protein